MKRKTKGRRMLRSTPARSAPARSVKERDGLPAATTSPAGAGVAKVVFACTVIAASVLVGTAAVLYYQEAPLREAEAALDRGDASVADRLLTQYRRKNSDNPRAMALQGRVLVAQSRDPDQAIRLFSTVGVANFKEARAWAQALMMRQQWTNALPLLQRVVQEDPNNVDAWYELASCRFRCGDRAKAIAAAERFAQFPGSEARGNVFVGSLHAELHNMKPAAEAMARVLQYEPEARNLQIPAHEFFVEYGRVLAEQHQLPAAIENIQKGIGLQRVEGIPIPAETLGLLASTVFQNGDPAQAKRLWQEALKISPSFDAAREGLAKPLVDLNQKAEAAEALELLEPLEERTDLPSTTCFLLQRAYDNLGDLDLAKKWETRTHEARTRESHQSILEKMALMQPDSTWGRAMIALRFAEDGNMVQAQAMLAPVLKENPNEPFLKQLWEATVDPNQPLPSIDIIPTVNF